MTTRLEMVTVYDHPTDFPKHYVGRVWAASSEGYYATGTVLCDEDLDNLRRRINEMGFGAKLDRSPGDDPKIMEVWL